MSKYDLLWEYQNNDLQLDRIEGTLKQSPLRQRLVKVRNVLVEAQEQLNRMDADAERKQAHFYKLAAEVDALEKELTQFIEDNHEEDAELAWEEIAEMRQEGEGIQEQLRRRDKDLNQIIAELGVLDKQIADLRVRVTKAKRAYATMKAQYDVELRKVAEEQAPFKKIREEMEPQVDPQLLARYKRLRQSHPTALARVIEGKCAGCNMSLAAVALKGVEAGEGIVECENCGRMLYLPD